MGLITESKKAGKGDATKKSAQHKKRKTNKKFAHTSAKEKGEVLREKSDAKNKGRGIIDREKGTLKQGGMNRRDKKRPRSGGVNFVI